ncbi:restriction endonuclease subunit S [Weeksellaceae bacterium KMM 9724]|uniref:restriction endonuclease subunit S n=1 Tax=Profundicola chukchiensis TaxID=2961959 RepID=UPI00243CDF99|nr:restriction endonuclease subunit S [Profundicola chukchiensis]MDG4951543.1 restriction endonuclease subunit S [Profundicola chukchiensis]
MKIVALGDYIKQVRGVSYKSGDSIKEPKTGYLPVLRSNNIEESNINFDDLVYVPEKLIKENQLLRKGDILLTASTGSIKVIGKNGYIEEDYNGSFGAFCKVVRPLKSIDSRYLKHYFQSKNYRRYIKNIVNGANINNIKNGHIDELKIPLPPLETQKKIAAILDEADKLRQLDQQLIEKYDELTQSLFLDMFGDPVMNPKGWDEINIEKISIIVTKGSSPKWQGFDYIDSGVRFITSENVRLGFLDCDKDKFVSEEFHDKLERSKLKENDLLVNLVGASIGRGALMERKYLPANINQAVAKIELNIEKINPAFVLNQIITPQIQERLIGNKVEGARANISLKNVRELKILYPPIEIQNQFAERVEAIEAQKALAQQSLEKSEELFNSLLQKAFKGELV